MSRRLDWPQIRTLWGKQEPLSLLGFEKERLADALNVLLTCIVIYPYNMNQQDALFTFNTFQ